MICETCHGVGMKITFRPAGALKSVTPCPDCHGGVAHCCEGEREQPSKSSPD